MEPKLFPSLPALEVLIPRLSEFDDANTLRQTGIVCCQHLLETTGSLVESVIDGGVPAANIFVLGKIYSSNADVSKQLGTLGCHVVTGSPATVRGCHADAIRGDAQELWELSIKYFRVAGVRRIIILDDGGSIHLQMPTMVKHKFTVVGIEQTTFGMAHNALVSSRGLRVINVASSAAKRHFETPLICDAVLRSANALIAEHSGCRVGIIGIGKIGFTLAEKLSNRGHETRGFDTNFERMRKLPIIQRCKSVGELIQSTDLIFGCTGRDTVSSDQVLAATNGTKTFASCSSGDIEFRSLLQADLPWRIAQRSNERCPTFISEYPPHQLSLRVVRSGYPVNFDNSVESVPAYDIQVTRGLLLAAVLQALRLLGEPARQANGSVMLDPVLQAEVIQAYLSDRKIKLEFTPDRDWCVRESQGLIGDSCFENFGE